MATTQVERRLAAILVADVVGYTRLVEADEAGTLTALSELRGEIIDPLLARHHGRVVKLMGDGQIAEFASVVDAVSCAVAIQTEIAAAQATRPPERRIVCRIGINLGDVVIEGEDLLGDGVNVAARLEQLCEPGGILISGTAFDHLQGKLDLPLDYRGEQQVKNIARAVRTYSVRLGGLRRDWRLDARRLRRWRFPAAAALILLIVGVAVWLRPWEPRLNTASIGNMALPLPDKPSIAVLPFDNLSADPAQGYFADGMTEDLITDLSKISGIFVIARNSSWAYKGKPTKVQQVAEELGVRYVLEGSVRREGDQVRINAQLIDAIGGQHLWADRYDGQVGDVFALQDKVIQRIVEALAVEFAPPEAAQIGAGETDIPQAYDYLLQGWSHFRLETQEEVAKAISNFEKAIELDPGYSRAHAALAAAYWWRVNLSWDYSAGDEFESDYNHMVEHLALALEKPTSVAYRVSADFLAQQGHFGEALGQINKAMVLGPSEPDSYISKARILVAMGRAEEAETATRLAMRLNPQYPPDYLRVLGRALFHLRRYEESAQAMERVVSLDPSVYMDYATLTAIYGYLGRTEDSNSAIKKYTEVAINGMASSFTVQEQGFWWYGYMFDYDEGYREQLLEGLRKAGVPEGAGTDISYDDYSRLISESDGEYDVEGATKIDTNAAKMLQERGVVFIDVRPESVFQLEHIPGAANLDLNTALSKESLSRLVGKSDEVAISCFGKHCPYAALACAKAVTWGFKKVFYFAGGFPAWKAAGYPVEPAAEN